MNFPTLSPSVTALLRPVATRGTAVAACLALAAGLAACSSAHNAASGSPSASSSSAAAAGGGHRHSRTTSKDAIPGLITFAGTFRMHGAKTKKLSFRAFPGVTSPASSCAKLASGGTPAAKGEQPLFRIPAPPAGNSVYFTAEVMPYHGAGTYGKDAIPAAGSSIVAGGKSYNLGAAQASASVTVNANGSGSFTFANAPSSKAGPALSGTVHWTCSG